MNINLEHICCNTHALPEDFFRQSIFGKSMINEHDTTAPRTPTELNINQFRRVGFPESFCTSLEHGLSLLLGANPPRRLVPNHNTANLHENREFITTTLAKWEAMNIISYVREQPYIVNPLSVVDNGKKKRLVLDARSSGLNDHIISPKFHLPNIEEIMQTLQHNDFMIKMDLANGFLQLPIRCIERTFLGFKNPVDGRFGVFNRLSFGLRSAPFIFATFTHAIKHALRQVLNLRTEVYIDDWFLANHSLETLTDMQSRFVDFLSSLGVAIQYEKTEGPSRCITYLGLSVDTNKDEIRLPEVKRMKYLMGLEELLQAEHPKMAQLAKAAGRLVHISFVHREGAANIQPLWDILYKERTQWTRAQLEREGLTIDSELHSCLQWWRNLLSIPDIRRTVWVAPNGDLFLWSMASAKDSVANAKTICTDASNEGWGASSGTCTRTGIWSNRQKRNSINWRELKAVTLAIISWEFIRNTPVLILSDSSTVIAAVRKRASKTHALQNLLKELSDLEKSRNIEVVALHIPGVLNDLPDRLSRGMPVTAATLLSFENDASRFAIKDPNLIGMIWNNDKRNAIAFNRLEAIKVAPQNSVIAVSTPDIPFLKKHLHHLSNHPFTTFILIPKILTSEYPIPSTEVVEQSCHLKCLNAINIEWILLKII